MLLTPRQRGDGQGSLISALNAPPSIRRESISRTAVASASTAAPPNSARPIIPPATPAPSMKDRGTRGMPGKGVRPPPGSAAQSEMKSGSRSATSTRDERSTADMLAAALALFSVLFLAASLRVTP